MKNALAKREDGGGRFEEPLEKLMLKLDMATFSRAQAVDNITLRVYCPQNRSSVNFTLANMDKKKHAEREWMTLDLNLDEGTFLGIMNPKLKVIFQYDNILAPFAAVSMARGSLFSAHPPLLDLRN